MTNNMEENKKPTPKKTSRKSKVKVAGNDVKATGKEVKASDVKDAISKGIKDRKEERGASTASVDPSVNVSGNSNVTFRKRNRVEKRKEEQRKFFEEQARKKAMK